MANHNRWIKFYPRDWIADTRTLTTEEQGAYFLLWMESVIRDGKLPADPDALRSLALVREPNRWKKIWGKIGHYFQLADGGSSLVQRRVLQELDLAKERVENARRGGKASAESRSTRQALESDDSPTGVEHQLNDQRELGFNDQDHDQEQDQDQPAVRLAGVPVRSNGSAKPIPLDPISLEKRRWGAEEWFEAFRMAWLTYCEAGSYGGQPGDYRATGDLRDVLRNLALPDALAAQARASTMFAEYFGDHSAEVAAARHPWSWFVTRFNGLRIPKKAAPADDRCAFHQRGGRGKLPNYPKDSCPECRHAKALAGGRTGDPTPAADALVIAADRKAAEMRAAAAKTWTPEQQAEMREALQRDRQPVKAAAT